MLNTSAIDFIKTQYLKLYTDTANVYGYTTTTTPAGITRKGKATEPTISNMPCRISQKSINSPIQNHTESNNTISYEIKMFCPPEYEIKAGSKIEITRCGKVIIIYETGEPFIYPTHQEIILHRFDKA
jgi:hypothetical protein